MNKLKLSVGVASFFIGAAGTWVMTRPARLDGYPNLERAKTQVQKCFDQGDARCIADLCWDGSIQASGMTKESFEQFLKDELFADYQGEIGVQSVSSFGGAAGHMRTYVQVKQKRETLTAELLTTVRDGKTQISTPLPALVMMVAMSRYSEAHPGQAPIRYVQAYIHNHSAVLESKYGIKGVVVTSGGTLELLTWNQIKKTIEDSNQFSPVTITLPKISNEEP